MIDKKLIKNTDFSLLIVVFSLFIIGLIAISSTSYNTHFVITRDIKIQSLAFILGCIAIIFLQLIDYHIFGTFHKAIYIFSIILLLAVYIPGIGKVQYNARGWIDLGPVDLQPAEIVKITFILSFAKFLEKKQNCIDQFRDLLPIALFASIPILLILKEPDLGNATVLVFIILGMVFVSGIQSKLLLKIFAFAALLTPILYKLMKPHQKIRIDAYLNPENLTLPGNYQVWNSKVAIGSGNFWGKGLFLGTQKRLKFLPVQESDFIFAVICEEFGFLGGFTVILLYYFFLYRLFLIAKNSKDIYGTLVSIGIFSMFAFQIFENIGMTMGVMPVTGITLPFISYGGSSVLTNMIAVGIVLNINMRRKVIKF